MPLYPKIMQNPLTINIGGRLMDFATPKVMGIINVTPDSFFSGSRRGDAQSVSETTVAMLQAGAEIIDLGGYSTRPGAPDVTPDEEYSRLAMGLEAIRKVAPEAPVSIDTFRASVARKCVEEWHAEIINDISGGDLDPEMFTTVAELNVPYILMHTRGTPANMNQLCQYEDVTAEVISDLAFKMAKLRNLGVNDIIIDPGFGFAKDLDQNYALLARLQEFRRMGCPVLAGMSRKSMAFRLLGITPTESLNATTVLNTIALMGGADILRVHDVKEAVQVVKIVEALKRNSTPAVS